MQIGGIFLSQLRATHQLYQNVAGHEEEDDDDGVDYDYDSDCGNGVVRRKMKKGWDKDNYEGEGGQSEFKVDERGENEAKSWVKDNLGPADGWRELDIIRNSPPPFSRLEQCFIAFLAGFVITVLAFDGSTADAACAGAFAWFLTGLALFASGSNPLIGKVFELLAAFLISAFSRGIYSHSNHRLCYSAISSGGIVLALPAFSVSEYLLDWNPVL